MQLIFINSQVSMENKLKNYSNKKNFEYFQI